MGNSGSHNSSAITDYQIFKYTKRTLYNIPIGVKYFYFDIEYAHVKIELLIIKLSRKT